MAETAVLVEPVAQKTNLGRFVRDSLNRIGVRGLPLWMIPASTECKGCSKVMTGDELDRASREYVGKLDEGVPYGTAMQDYYRCMTCRPINGDSERPGHEAEVSPFVVSAGSSAD